MSDVKTIKHTDLTNKLIRGYWITTINYQLKNINGVSKLQNYHKI